MTTHSNAFPRESSPNDVRTFLYSIREKKPRYYITSKSAQEGILTTMIYERFIPFMERNRQKGEHVLIYTGKNLCLTTTDLTQFRPTETKMTRFIRVKGTFNFRCLYCKHSFITFYIGFKQARKMLRCL